MDAKDRPDTKVLFEGALAVLLQRAGGELRFTESDHRLVEARHGRYKIRADVDRSGAAPVIVIRIVPGTLLS